MMMITNEESSKSLHLITGDTGLRPQALSINCHGTECVNRGQDPSYVSWDRMC